MDDFFDHAISTSSLDHDPSNPLALHAIHHARPGPSTNDSSDTMVSYDSGIYSMPPSLPASPPLESPGTGQDNHIGGMIQLVWSAEETYDLARSGTALSDQHHEKSCARCSLTVAEARKCRLDRRREQNRESQRKFRARKEAKIREAASQVAVLETYVEFLEKHNNDLEAVNSRLQQQIADLEIGKHVCTARVEESAQHGIHGKNSELEIWGSRTSSTAISTSAGQPNSVHISDLQLSLFDHELLPPYHPLMDDH